METLEIIAEEGGQRLDRFLAQRYPSLSRSQLQRLIRQGYLLVNGRPEKASLKLRPGDHLRLTIPPPQPVQLEPEDIPVRVFYEDQDLLVVDKPAGLAVHPGPGHPSHTLVNALLARCPDLKGIGGELRPGIVHRLDKDTSGLMVVAKNDLAHQELSRQFKSREVVKRYLALVWGSPPPGSGAIDAPLGRDPSHRQRMAVVTAGRDARTRYRALQQIGSFTLLEVTPETGRTHQIRVHLASIGHPLVGDATYSRRPRLIPRHFLHAHTLGLRLPSTGEYREFTSPLPADLEEALEMCREHRAV